MKLNLETVKALVLAEIEKEGEDYIYKEQERQNGAGVMCSNYEADGTPSCLVGRALDAGGIITFEALSAAESTTGAVHLLGSGIDDLVTSLGIGIDDDAFNFLWTLQDSQDAGVSWGEAFRRASETPVAIRYFN